jgi:MFS transporter, FHS family, glucose/mannose:H+ symporter
MMKKIFDSRLAFHSVLFCYVSLFLYGLLDNTRGPIYPSLLEKYQLSSFVGSWFFSATSFVFLVASALAPSFLSKRGYLRGFRESLVLMGLGQLLFFWAPHFSYVLVGCIFLGFGMGTISVIQNVLVLVSSPKDKATQIVNGLHANYAGASLLAPLLVAFLFRHSIPFEYGFLFGALSCFVLLGASFSVKALVEPERHKISEGQSRLASVFKGRYLPMAILASSYVAGEILLSSRLSQYLVKTQFFSSERASLWTSAFFVCLLLGRLMFTFFHFRISTKRLVRVLLSCSVVLSLVGLLVTPMALVLLGFFISPLYAMVMVIAKKEFPKEIESVTSLMLMLTGVFIVSSNMVVGLVTDSFGIQAALFLIPIFFLLSLGLLKGRFSEH